MKTVAVSVKGVSKSYGDLKAVNDLSFEVEQSTCFGLLGPNGAGKTTMMKMLYGKARRNKSCDGSISVFGYEPKNEDLQVKSLSGIVPQEDNLDQELDVEKNLMIYSKLHGLSKQAAKKRIEELLDFMELTEKRNVSIRELSGGMKRRLIIARALLNNPRLLILDEPTTGLDPQVRHIIWDKLRQLIKEGVTILLTTHYMEEAYQICDKILIMHKGVKIMEGNPAELLSEHIEKYVLEIIRKELMEEIKREFMDEKIRFDETAQVALVHSDDLGLLEKISHKLPLGSRNLRQSNLEDLFLKTTGRTLNEFQ